MKKLLLKSMLLLCALIVGSSSVWAKDGDTHDFEQSLQQLLNKKAAIEDIDIAQQSYPVKKVIVSYRYNNTKTNAVTIEVSVGGTSWGTFNVNGTGSNYTTQEFTGDAAIGAINISFTNNTTANTGCGTFYVNNVQLVEGVQDSRTAIGTIGELAPTDIPLNGTGNFTLGVTAAAEYSISYESSDNNVLAISGDEYLSGDTKGSVTVTATVTPTDAVTYKPVSKEFTVTVYDPNAGDGSEARPFSVAEALENTPASGTSSSYYIKGIVTRFYGSATDVYTATNNQYYINDGSDTDELLVYRGKNIGNVAFSSADDIKVGDELVIYGGLTTYSSTKEIAANDYIISINGKKLSGISYATTSYNSLPAAAFEAPSLINPNSLDVTYSSNDAEIAAVNSTTGAVTIGEKVGTATITATFAGNSSFLSGTAIYTITTARGEANISFDETSVTLTKGDAFTAPAFQNPNSLTGIVFTSSYNDVATVSDAGVISLGGSTGTAIITATYAQSVQYNAGSATCKIVVNPAGVTPEPSSTGYYVKVTADSQLETGQYLIVNESAKVAYTGSNPADATHNVINVTISDSKITETTDTKANEFTINLTDGSIKAANNKYIGRTANSTGVTVSDEAMEHEISISSGDATIKCTSNNYIIRYNSSSSQDRFRYYSGTSCDPVQLYKYVAGANPDDIDIYVSEAGYATYASNFDLDFSTNGNLKAYIAKEVSSEIKMVEVEKVAAGTGVLLHATDGGGKAYTVETTTETTADVTGNLFKRGNDEAVAYEAGGGKYNYILNVVNNQLGFYKAAGKNVAKNRAYLQTSIAASRIDMNFDEEVTGIKLVETSKSNNEGYYNLAGQRVAQPTKGLYIVNGRKVIIK